MLFRSAEVVVFEEYVTHAQPVAEEVDEGELEEEQDTEFLEDDNRPLEIAEVETDEENQYMTGMDEDLGQVEESGIVPQMGSEASSSRPEDAAVNVSTEPSSLQQVSERKPKNELNPN